MRNKKTRQNPYLVGEEKLKKVNPSLRDYTGDKLRGCYKHLSNVMEKDGRLNKIGKSFQVSLRGNMKVCF